MTQSIHTALPGYANTIVEVECRISRGLPTLLIVGFASRSVGEAKERVRAAFAASRLKLPPQRIVINLAPGDIPKEGTGLDAAIALSILTAQQPDHHLLPRSLVFGELGLDGSLRPVRGLIGGLLSGRQRGYINYYIPASQYQQAALVPGLRIIPVQSLAELYRLLLGQTIPAHPKLPGRPLLPQALPGGIDLSHIAGQAIPKRVLEIAAAGGHNVLLTGPPGTGKSLLAQALPSILPPLSQDEILEVTHLHSLVSRQYEELVTQRPFRAPHHTASSRALLGGGPQPLPGEISLAHHGVLLLDELPEFSRATLEALRQPLENKTTTISHARGSTIFPAHFLLVATANPCPCGYFDTSKACRCPPYSLQRYQQKLSGPLLDRIDLQLQVTASAPDHLMDIAAETSQAVQQRVVAAHQRQQHRQACQNADLSARQLQQVIWLSPAVKKLLDTATLRWQLSTRAYMRTLKVARTIADLAESQVVTAEHLQEALSYRQ